MFLSLSLQAPHPLYQPSNDLVACRHPLCAALHPPGDYKCESPDQCDYEVEYADGGSSLGVLVRDVFSLNYTNGVRLSPRLALGFVLLSKIIFDMSSNIPFKFIGLASCPWHHPMLYKQRSFIISECLFGKGTWSREGEGVVMKKSQ